MKKLNIPLQISHTEVDLPDAIMQADNAKKELCDCRPLPDLSGLQGPQPYIADVFGRNAGHFRVRTSAEIPDLDQVVRIRKPTEDFSPRLRWETGEAGGVRLPWPKRNFPTKNLVAAGRRQAALCLARRELISAPAANGFDLPDGGRTVSALAAKAPGGAFDPRDVAKLPAQELGYKAEWVVERFRRYNLDWDITGLRLTSLDPEAKNYPWFIIINGGAANFYEFFVDLKNRPGWAQYLAQKLNVMIVTIPGNFKYGGWDLPIADPQRQPAYLLDRELSGGRIRRPQCDLHQRLIMQGLKALVQKQHDGRHPADRPFDVRRTVHDGLCRTRISRRA